MKPQDLRIGNYVRIKVSGKIAKVCVIAEANIAVWRESNGTRTVMDCQLSEIEPVLIREVYDRLPQIKNLQWCDRTGDTTYYYKDIPMDDLHELQNIHYALTGNEIEIEI